MKFNKTASLFAAVIIAAMPFGNVLAAGESETKLPVYPDSFNKNDLNGTVMIELPEDVTAHVEITFDSPEGKGISYYDCNMDGTGYFDIEGRDTSDDDYRSYNLTISLTGGEYGRTAEVTDTFTVLDPNDHPNTKEENLGGIDGGYIHSKEYKLHFGVLMGEVDGDGIITGSDATLALAEYTLISSGSEGTFSDYQKAVSDVNKDDILTGTDATMILRYYTAISSGGNPSWT